MLSKKAIIPLVLAAIFLLSSIPLVGYFSGSKAKSPAKIIVDMGGGKIYSGTIPLTENTTALNALSNFAYSVEIENGSTYCVADFCNTNASVWKFYTTEETALGPVEKEINQSLETYKVSSGETIVLRYESI